MSGMTGLFWIVEYVVSFIEIFMCCYFCSTFLVKKENKYIKRKMIIMSVMEALLIFLISRAKLYSDLNIIVFFIMSTLIQWIMYRRKYLMTLGLVVVYITILSAVDMIVVYLVIPFAEINTAFLLEGQSFLRCVCLLMSKCFLIIFVVLHNRIVADKKTIPRQYLMIMGLSSAFLLLSNVVLMHKEMSIEQGEVSNFTVFFFIASLGIEMVVFWLVIKLAESYEQKKSSALIELNNRMLKNSLAETENTFALWRKSVHDYKNNIMALTQLAEEGNIDEIRKYLGAENVLMAKKIFYIKTGNSVADAVINTKQAVAEKEKILFVVNACFPEKIVMSDTDMAGVLGNLLDNSIEASVNEKDPYIEIDIRQEKKFLIMSIKNKYTGEYPVNEKTRKSNPEFHGIGLKSVRSIVKKYGGEMIVETKDDEYVVNILVENLLNITD